MATIKDVAELAGCSYTTVSLVVNGKAKGRVSAAVQDKIFAAAKHLNYVPNIAAKNLKSLSEDHFSIVAFWPDDYRMSFISRLLNGLNAEISNRVDNIDVIIRPYKYGMLSEFFEVADSASYHGAIFAGISDLDLEYLENTDFQIPIVIINRSSDKYATVGIDNYYAGKKAAQYLYDLGIRNVTAVSPKSQLPATTERHNGFAKVWSKKGDTSISYITSGSTITDGYTLAKEILCADLPEAFFFDTDAIARGFLCGAYEMNVHIPEDVSVLAMGQYTPESSAFTIPPLTTVEIPHELFAGHALNILMSLIKKEFEEPCHMLFNAQIRERGSCKPFNPDANK